MDLTGSPLTPFEPKPDRLRVPEGTAAMELPDPLAQARAISDEVQAQAAQGIVPDPLKDAREYSQGVYENIQAQQAARPWLEGIPATALHSVNRLIADSPDPEDAAWRVGTAAQYSRILGIPLQEAMDNIEPISQAMTAKPYMPKTSWKAAKDQWDSGWTSLQLGKLALKWQASGGTDTAIEAQLDALQAKIDALSEDAIARPWYQDALKGVAGSAPYMIQNIVSGATMAAGVGLGVAALGAEVGSGGLGTPITVAAAAGAAYIVGSAAETFQISDGLAYYRLRKQGHSHGLSEGLAASEGAVQAAIESLIGFVPGARWLTGSPADDILTKAISKRITQAGVIPSLGTAVAKWGSRTLAESGEEYWQEWNQIATDAIAQAMEDVGYDTPTFKEAAGRAGKAFVSSLAASAIFSAGDSYKEFRGDVRAASAVKSAADRAIAEGLDFKAFSRDMEETYANMRLQGATPVMDQWDEATRAKITKSLWDKAQKQATAARAAQEKATNLPDIAEEVGRGTPNKINGRLYTQDRTVYSGDDGEIKGIFKLGDPEAKGKNAPLLAYVGYTKDGDTVSIDRLSWGRVGKETRREFMQDFMEAHAGEKIEWRPKTDDDQALYDELVQDNPRGPEFGLQWYNERGQIERIRTKDHVVRQLRSMVGKTKLKAEQVPVLAASFPTMAQDLGMGVDEFIQTVFADQGFTMDSELAASVSGQTIDKFQQDNRGATAFERMNNAHRAIIYMAEKADATTFFHEVAHAYQTAIIRNRALNEKFAAKAAEIEKAFGVADGNWDAEATGVWAEKWAETARAKGYNLSFREAFSYGFEEYLRTGKAPTPEQATIFQKIAEWFFEIYNAIAPRVKLNADIVRVYEGMMGGTGPVAELARKRDAPTEQKAVPEEALYQPSAEEMAQADEEMAAVRKQYEGTDAWMKAPNGQPTKLTEHQWLQVRTPAFKAWFGDWEADPANASKVVDENGEPLVVYHGSGAENITEFSIDKYETVRPGDWGRGIYFTPSWGTADSYRRGAVERTDTSANEAWEEYERKAEEFGTKIMYARIDLNAGKITESQYNELKKLDNKWRLSLEESRNKKGGQTYETFLKILNPENYTWAGITDPYLTDVAISENRDGVIVSDESGNIEEIIVFSPTQIKSATGNRGTFDASEPSILFQYAGENAQLADEERAALEEAKKLDTQGVNSEEIRQRTGWFKGKYDGKWRVETENNFTMKKPWAETWDTLENIIDFPELFNKYPQLKNLLTHLEPKEKGNIRGEYSRATEATDTLRGREAQLNIYASTEEEGKEVISHEIQHAIQDIEGFPRGGSPEYFKDQYRSLMEEVSSLNEAMNEAYKNKDMETYHKVMDKRNELIPSILKLQGTTGIVGFDSYTNTAGEIEARDIAARFPLDATQRRAIPPYSSENILPSDAIVLNQPAFHGSPYRFKSFSTDRIGSGAGEQRYGWGLYFASKKEIADTYRAAPGQKKQGPLYAVEIPEDDDFLRWERPLSESSKKVQAGVKKALKRLGLSDILTDDDPAGGRVYERIAEAMGSQEQASRALLAAGVQGTAFSDGTARSRKDASFNYVVFDDSQVEIEEVLAQHTQEELSAEAKTFDTWEEFKEYSEGLYLDSDDTFTENMTPEQIDDFYRTTWEKAKAPEKWAPDRTEEANREFAESIKSDAGLKSYLLDMYMTSLDYSFMRAIARGEAEAQEDVDQADQMVKNEAKVNRRASPVVKNAAVGIYTGKATAKILNSARGIILNNLTEYRRLMGELKGEQLAEEAASTPYIQDPRWAREAEILSIEKRRRLARTISNEDIARKIARGQIAVDDPELKEHLAFMTTQVKEGRAEIAKAEAKAAMLDDNLSDTQRAAIKLQRELKEYQARLTIVEKRAAAFLERQAEVPAATTQERDRLQRQIAATESAFTRAKAGAKNDAAYLDALSAAVALRKEKARVAKLDAERRAAAQVRAEMQRLADRATKPFGKKPHIDLQYRRKIEELTRQLDPRFRSKKTLDKLNRWRDFLDRDPANRDMMEPAMIARIQARPLNEWTLNELRDFTAQVDLLREQGRRIWREKDIYKHERRETAQRQMIDAALAGKEFRRAVGAPKPSSVWTKVKLATLRPLAILLELDGGERGIFTQWLWDKYNEAWSETERQKDLRYQAMEKRMADLGFTLEPLGKKGKQFVGESVTILDEKGKEFLYDNGRKPTVQDVMFWSIGKQNEQTYRALLEGNRIPEFVITRGIDQMTNAQRDLAAAISKDFDDNFDRLVEAFEAQYNAELPAVEHYVPMRRLEVTHETRGEQIAVGLAASSGYTKAFTEKGNTKHRIENIQEEYQAPIRTDLLSLWHESVSNEEAFIAQDWLIHDVQAIINRPNVLHAIQQRMGPEAVRWVKKYVNDLARGEPESSVMTGTERWMQGLRGHLAISYLSFNVLSGLKQLVSPLPYLADAGPGHLLASAGKYLAAKGKAVKGKQLIGNDFISFVEQRSEAIKNRSISRDFMDAKRMAQSNTANETLRKLEALEKKIGAVGMKHLEVIDKVSVCIGWRAVYDKALSKGMSEELAIREADDVTALTQPSGRVQDLAEIYRGGEFLKLFTMFTNALNAQWNMMAFRIPRAIRQKQYWKAVGDAVSLALCGLGIALVSGALYGDDDEEKKKKIIFGLAGQYMDSIPLLGTYASMGLKAAMRMSYFNESGVNPFPAGEKYVNAVGAVAKGDFARALGQTIEGIGYAMGLPVVGGKRVIDAMAEQNPALLIGWRKE